MSEQLRFDVQERVATLTLNRPDKLNAFTAEMIAAWADALEECRRDDAIHVIVVTGAGRAFCAGGDLAEMRERVEEAPLQQKEFIWSGVHRIPKTLEQLDKPVIAAVNGVAYAGGLEWACFADIRIADEHASFGVTCRRWNVGLGDGGTQRLPRILGMGRAMELILTGRVIDAAEAERIGLANEVTPTGGCLPRAIELAEELAALPQPAMRTDKEAAVRGFGRPLDEGLMIEAQCFNKLLETPEIADGIRKFVERDHPDRQPDGGAVTEGLVRGRGTGAENGTSSD